MTVPVCVDLSRLLLYSRFVHWLAGHRISLRGNKLNIETKPYYPNEYLTQMEGWSVKSFTKIESVRCFWRLIAIQTEDYTLDIRIIVDEGYRIPSSACECVDKFVFKIEINFPLFSLVMKVYCVIS